MYISLVSSVSYCCRILLLERRRFEGGGGVITDGNSSDVVGTFIFSLKEEEVHSDSTRFEPSQITASRTQCSCPSINLKPEPP
ncbi:hypothetical protein C0J52_13428 [Blattella germanica]|nr:hypothetical protein C0J52_13428 [Blattella germanica]